MTSPFWPIVATAVGGLLSIISGVLTSILTQRATLAREREVKQVEWERQRVEAERKNFRDLQLSLKNVRQLAFHAAEETIHQAVTGKPVEKAFPERAMTRFGDAISEAVILRSWVEQEEIRALVDGALQGASEVCKSKSTEEAETRSAIMGKRMREVFLRIGDEGRTLAKR